NQFLVRVLLIFLALLITDKLFTDIRIEGFTVLLAVSILLALLNSVIKPLLILITIPVTIGSLGFFLLIINAMLLLFTAKLIDGFYIASFATAFWGGISLSILNVILGRMLKK
ncbi:MAG: phage holin family protein, partial [Candidatus Marinimicrobia bacterium]|nr:phage holin family protein [Candidatus Neomarinimicrobiota bacterium]